MDNDQTENVDCDGNQCSYEDVKNGECYCYNKKIEETWDADGSTD